MLRVPRQSKIKVTITSKIKIKITSTKRPSRNIDMPSILIPTPLRKLTNEQETVSAAGANVGELLDNLDRAYPGLKERVCDEQGNVRRFVNIFVNGEDIRFLEEKATPVKDADEISIVPAIAGG
jgi:molybdopterin synthase sulfur carrier subunit